MNSRLPLDRIAIGAMVISCAVMGMQQVALKSVEADMSPVLQLALRSAIAAVLVAIWMKLRREPFTFTDGTLAPGMVLGVLFTLEYLFLGEGLRHTSASRMVIFLYTAPLFAAMVLHLLREDERLQPLQWLGIIMAFCGIALAISINDETLQPVGNRLLGDVLGILAGFAWGMSTVVVRTTRLAEAAPAKTLFYQLLVAFALLMLASVLLGRMSFSLTPMLVGNLFFQGVVVSFVVFLVWLSLLRRYIASQLGVLSFMSPVFGVAFGVLLLGEPLHLRFLLGSIMVLSGILLVSSEHWRGKRAHATATSSPEQLS